MNLMFGPARFSGASNVTTYLERVSRKARNLCAGARSCEGLAAISHDGHGVGTEPIYPIQAVTPKHGTVDMGAGLDVQTVFGQHQQTVWL